MLGALVLAIALRMSVDLVRKPADLFTLDTRITQQAGPE